MMDRGGSAAPPCQAAVGDAEREKRNTRTSHPMFLSDDGRRCVGPPGGPGPLWSAKISPKFSSTPWVASEMTSSPSEMTPSAKRPAGGAAESVPSLPW